MFGDHRHCDGWGVMFLICLTMKGYVNLWVDAFYINMFAMFDGC